MKGKRKKEMIKVSGKKNTAKGNERKKEKGKDKSLRKKNPAGGTKRKKERRKIPGKGTEK